MYVTGVKTPKVKDYTIIKNDSEMATLIINDIEYNESIEYPQIALVSAYAFDLPGDPRTLEYRIKELFDNPPSGRVFFVKNNRVEFPTDEPYYIMCLDEWGNIL